MIKNAKIFLMVAIFSIISGLCYGQSLDLKDLSQTLEKMLGDKLKGRTASQVAEIAGKLGHLNQLGKLFGKGGFSSLIEFDDKNQYIAFSPAFMQLAAFTAQQRLTSFKKFSFEPRDDRMSFNIEFAEGSKVALDFVPETIELDINEFSIVGLIPEGIKLEQPEIAATGLAGYLDAFLGVSEKVGKLLKTVSFDGNTVSLRRPYQASVLGRAMKQDGQDAAKGAIKLPFKMENGWLRLSYRNLGFNNNMVEMAVKMLLERFK